MFFLVVLILGHKSYMVINVPRTIENKGKCFSTILKDKDKDDKNLYYLSFNISTRRYGLQCGPTSSSCQGLWPSTKAFFFSKKGLFMYFGYFEAIFIVQ